MMSVSLIVIWIEVTSDSPDPPKVHFQGESIVCENEVRCESQIGLITCFHWTDIYFLMLDASEPDTSGRSNNS